MNLLESQELLQRHRWKATEYRQFLLYTGPVALLNVLASPVYNNFMLLYFAISILACPNLCVIFCDFAKTLLVSFVEHFGQFYGRENLGYNVHGLIRLSDDVKEHGQCLDNISGFPYENYLWKNKENYPQRSVPSCTSCEANVRENADCSASEQNKAKLKKPHSEVPLPSTSLLQSFSTKRLVFHTFMPRHPQEITAYIIMV